MRLDRFDYLIPAIVGSTCFGVATGSLWVAIGTYCVILAVRPRERDEDD